jgi:CDP-glucose 4,6-dehydratase
VNPDFWRSKRVFITGHTGFKGAWLSYWLTQAGATVRGYALAPATQPNLFTELKLAESLEHTVGDIRDLEKLSSQIREFRPDVVFHLAAQALVSHSYTDPLGTYSTNVMGTLHVLESLRTCPSAKAAVIVTSDKCYDNKGWVWPYREDDPLGGHDIYSSSKACAEIASASFRESFLKTGCKVATARAGNVIGGGDWSDNRIVPDIVRAALRNETLILRRPQALRPWQHVVDPLKGYVQLAERLCGTDGARFAEAWNFGPSSDGEMRVEEIARAAREAFPKLEWRVDPPPFEEAKLLTIDSSKARQQLEWRPTWNTREALELTFSWHKGHAEGQSAATLTKRQLESMASRADAL